MLKTLGKVFLWCFVLGALTNTCTAQQTTNIKIDKNKNVELSRALAFHHLKNKRYDEAARFFEHAFQGGLINANARLALSHVYFDFLGETDKADKHLEIFLLRHRSRYTNKERAAFFFFQARIKDKQGNKTARREACRNGLDEDPQPQRAIVCGRYEEECTILSEVLAKTPKELLPGDLLNKMSACLPQGLESLDFLIHALKQPEWSNEAYKKFTEKIRKLLQASLISEEWQHLEELLSHAAEKIYQSTDPYLLLLYLYPLKQNNNITKMEDIIKTMRSMKLEPEIEESLQNFL